MSARCVVYVCVRPIFTQYRHTTYLAEKCTRSARATGVPAEHERDSVALRTRHGRDNGINVHARTRVDVNGQACAEERPRLYVQTHTMINFQCARRAQCAEMCCAPSFAYYACTCDEHTRSGSELVLDLRCALRALKDAVG